MEDRQFNPMKIFLTPISTEKDYKTGHDYDGKTVKWGQLKLLMGEIIFLLDHCDASKYDDGIVFVVAGGASGEHYVVLLEMFPIIKRLDLWDSRDFSHKLDKYEREGRVRYYKEYMLEHRIKEVYPLINRNEAIFFASDIRTVTNDGVDKGLYTNAKKEYRIWFDDNMLQANFVRTLKPEASLLKFRLPYVLGEDDLIKEDKLPYIKGIIYTQCFNGLKSSETRLVPIKGDDGELIENYIYSKSHHEKAMMYYNTEVRNSKYIRWHNYTNNTSDIYDEQLVSCFDTCYVLYILDKYIYYIGEEEEDRDIRYKFILELWRWILDLLKRTLTKNINLKHERDVLMRGSSDIYYDKPLDTVTTSTGKKISLPPFLKNPRLKK